MYTFRKQIIPITFFSENPKLINLWEIWSTPPSKGDFPFEILLITTIAKSKIGIVKKSKTGCIDTLQKSELDGFQIKIMLKKAKQYPRNMLPESPMYILAGGRFIKRKPSIVKPKTPATSARLFWFNTNASMLSSTAINILILAARPLSLIHI